MANSTMAFVFAVAVQLLFVPVLGISYTPRARSATRLGVRNKYGVTRYGAGELKQTRKRSGFWWPGGSSNREAESLAGADDLTENISWGWHHPNGFFNSILVGAPLIDADMNIYLGADDAIRKFDYSGELVWIYGPRGLLTAAPTLASSTVHRMKETELGLAMEDHQAEEELRPSWMDGTEEETDGEIKDVKVGDIIQVKKNETKRSEEGEEIYVEGDIGEITKVTANGTRKQAQIMWKRTLLQSISGVGALHKRFKKVSKAKAAAKVSAKSNVLLGATNSGHVFSIDLATGSELWVTQVCPMIQGVKGVVAAKNGVLLVATDKCTDRYCYRYRSVTNPLRESNSMVRGLSIVDGHALWEFKPRSPVWNFVPQFSEDDDNETTVFFQDYEGSAYALNLYTGDLLWATYGYMGTYSQGHALYSPYLNAVYVMLVKHYDVGNGYEAAKVCNPFSFKGIHINCDTWPWKAGELWMLNASSGKLLRTSGEIPHPPASGTMSPPTSHNPWGRLVLGVGHNCHYNSPTLMYILSPKTLYKRWNSRGPTLWSWYCAGDKEGGDIRRALGQREKCEPGSWSTPVVDGNGDIYIGNQVGELQRWGIPAAGGTDIDMTLLSSLNTGVAFQDHAMAFAPGMMVVSTCTSLIVFHTSHANATFVNESWTTDVVPNLPYADDHRPYGEDGPATFDKPMQHDNGTYFRPYDVNDANPSYPSLQASVPEAGVVLTQVAN